MDRPTPASIKRGGFDVLMFANDGMRELTASGVTEFSRRQTKEAFELLDVIRERGRSSPEFLLAWLHERPRALQPLLDSGLRDRGYEIGCAACRAGAGAERLSVARARRRYGVRASRSALRAHRQHAQRRRALPPGTVTSRKGLPAHDARLDDDPRAEEPPYLD